MKLVKEHINEKFTQDSDPIRDMGIGIITWDTIAPGDIIKCIKDNPIDYEGRYAVIATIRREKKKITIASAPFGTYPVGEYIWVARQDFLNNNAHKNTWALSREYTRSITEWKKYYKIVQPRYLNSKTLHESLNEKFIKDSDPVHDMGIGIKPQIEKWLKEHGVRNYTINSDFTIDVNDRVTFADKEIGNFPSYIQFRRITNGYFSINRCNMTTLRGCPETISRGKTSYNGDFLCNNNKLTSLEYAPREISGHFNCGNNAKRFTPEDVQKVCNVEEYKIRV